MAEDINVTIDEEETLNVTIDSAISNHDNLTNVTEEQHRTTEQLQDHVATLIDGGTNITINYDDAGDTLTINGSGGGKTEEEIEDIVANALSGSGKASVTYDDANDTITIDVQANQEIDVQDSGSSVGTDPGILNFGTDLGVDTSSGFPTINFTGSSGGGGGEWTLDGTIDLTASTNYTLSTTYDIVRVIGIYNSTGGGFNADFANLQINNDTGSNYDYVELDGTQTTGASSFENIFISGGNNNYGPAVVDFKISGINGNNGSSLQLRNNSSYIDNPAGVDSGVAYVGSTLNELNFIVDPLSDDQAFLRIYGRSDLSA